jgi:hypothetical protein
VVSGRRLRVFVRTGVHIPQETDMMMQMCGPSMMIAGILTAILGLGLLASLIVLVWVVIARLRRDSEPVASR